jgi:hypothetical protein
MNKPLLIVSVVVVLGLVVLFMLGPFLPDPRADRVKAEIEFFQIGKKLSINLRTVTTAPQTLTDIKASGILADSDLAFLDRMKVVYTPPTNRSNLSYVILTMHEQRSGRDCFITLDGSMATERPN